MNLFKSSPEKELKALEKKREKEACVKRCVDILSEMCKLPICTTLSQNVDGCGVVNAVNGMVIILSGGRLKLRLVSDRSASGNYNYTFVLPEEAEKILAVWTMMSRPYYCLDWKNPELSEVCKTSETSNMAEVSP